MMGIPFSALVRCCKGRIAATLALFFCMGAASVKAQATEVKDLRSEFIVDSWQTDQGLPENFITSLAQSPDGYIWAGTFSGLARFNGSEFVVFDSANTPELPDSRVLELILDGAGRMWIRLQSGHLAYWHNGQFRLLNDREGPPLVEFLTIRLDKAGALVWSRKPTDTDYLRFDGKAFLPFRGEIDFDHLFGQTRDREGYAWGLDDGKLFTSNPKTPGRFAAPNFVPRMGWRVVPSRDGGVFVIAGNGIAKFKDGTWRDFGPLPIKTEQFDGYIEDHLGNLWLGVALGEIWRLQANGALTRFKLGDTTISQPAKFFLEDAEQNLWIGTGGLGLMRLKPRVLKSLDSRNGLASDVVRSVAAGSDGTIWLATVNSIDCFRPGNGERAEKRHPEIELPWRVYGGKDGELWVNTFGEGLFRFKAQGWDRYRPPRGTTSPPMLALLQTRAGEMFMGSSRGLFLVRDDELQKCIPPEATGTLDVRALAEGPSGKLYIGSNGSGLLCKSGDVWERFDARAGLSGDQISALWFDRENTLWIAVEGKGLARLKERAVFNFPDTTFGLPRVIASIIEDDSGRLWLGSNQGIYCVELRDLNAAADGIQHAVQVVRYDRSEGMGSSQCTGSSCKARDGKLWFATMSGVTVIDPNSLPHNPRPPPVVIEQILLDDKIAATSPRDGFTIPPGLHRLEIRFAGLSFTAPQRVRYRYRLSGYDPDWVDSGNRRVAYYTGIEPGEYRFQLRAANNDGVWNDAGATLQLIVQPFFWQRRSFQFAVLIFLLAAAAGLARYWAWVRVRQRLAELERRHALDKERGRISRDLHDSLGADLSQLALWSELALQAKDNPGMTQRVQDVSNLTHEMIQNVEEIVWTVNPKNDSVDRFTAYLCEFSERVVTRAGLRFRWEAPHFIPPIPLASDTRHHVFLATKEALNNIVKHAAASEVRISLAISDDSIAIVIADDGKGFDLQPAISSGGNGLGNMCERVSACGGAVTMETAPGRGTTICAKIPLPKTADK